MPKQIEQILYLSILKKPLLKYKIEKNKSNIKLVTTIKDAIFFLIDKPMTSLFIYDLQDDNNHNIQIISIINMLNSALPIIGLTNQKLLKENPFKNIHNSFTLLMQKDISFNKISKITKINPRRHNRINWPLPARIYLNDSTDKFLDGETICLSLGGAYIKTHKQNIKKNQKVLLELKFETFKFLTEAEIILVEQTKKGSDTGGFSVQFEHLTEVSSDYIESIINNKIMSKIFKSLNHKCYNKK